MRVAVGAVVSVRRVIVESIDWLTPCGLTASSTYAGAALPLLQEVDEGYRRTARRTFDDTFNETPAAWTELDDFSPVRGMVQQSRYADLLDPLVCSR
jgi:hypothetical protein